MKNVSEKYKKGFTLIELLVVISIISLLSTVTFASLGSARDKAKIAKAQSDLVQLRNAISIMGEDTGVWPNGCPVGQIIVTTPGSANEVALNAVVAGLSSIQPAPGSGYTDGNCIWTSSAIAAWRGPYIKSDFRDPWGNLYYFDNDYEAYRDCTDGIHTYPGVGIGTLAVVVSFGPIGIIGDAPFSGSIGNGYGCNQIFVKLY